MDIEQLTKKLDWMDEERRKDKMLIASLQDRIANMEDHQTDQTQRLQILEGEVSRFSVSLIKFDHFDAAMGQLKVELSRMIQEMDKQGADRDREQDKVRRSEMEEINKSIGEARKGLEAIQEIRKALQVRADGENKLSREMEEIHQGYIEYQRANDESQRKIKLIEEDSRQDAKRLTDLQGEVSALRKRVEEQRGKLDLASESMRKVDMRISELHAAETERRQGQLAFMEKQNMAALEKDKIWKDWQTRFQTIDVQSANFDKQIQSLESTHRSVKQAQENFEEISTRFERRINEITEMQRLIEDRFRQEWVSFKADDQKRWANYTLAQEEQLRELIRQLNKNEERIVTLEDLTQEIMDLSRLISEDNQKRLQQLVTLSREWAEEHGKNIQRSR